MRTKATLSSFVLVLVLYFVYGWGLVPLVLPNPSSGMDTGTEPSSSLSSSGTTRVEIEPFIDLLPPGEWERDPGSNIHLLQFGHIIVLFGKDTIEGNRLRLDACTIIVLPEGVDFRGDEASREQMRQAIVIRAPQYAELTLDRNFEIGNLQQLPNIVDCSLFGRVTIKSDMKDPGEHDDFYLETEGVRITEGLTRVEAPGEVRFNFGFHSGVGTRLVLELAPSDPSLSQSSFDGFKSASFRTLRSLRFVFPEDPNAQPRLSGGVYVPDGPATTVDVRCQGRFEFVANPIEQGWTASFYNNVEMERYNPDKSVDRLTAETAHLTLTSVKPEGEITAAGSKQSPLSDLNPTLFVAHGKAGQGSQTAVPARLSVAQNGGVTLIGDEIFVDLRKKFLSLSTRKGEGASSHVEMILANQYKIRSEQTLQYTLGQNGAFGTFASEGKGNMTGTIGEGASAKAIHLTWNEMQITPHPAAKDQVVLKLSKGITAQMTGLGTMTADSLDLFCDFVPSNPSASALSGVGNQKSNVRLDQAIVKENVRFDTASGTCRVKQLTIFFTNIVDGKVQHSRWMPQMLTATPPVAPPIAQGTPTLATAQPIHQVQHLQPLAPQNPTPMQPLQLYQPPAASVPAPAYSRPMATPLQQSPRPATGSVETQNLLGIKSLPGGGKFEMTGDQMRMRVHIQNGQSFAERVAIEGNVRLKENAAGNAPNTGIEIAGETVTIWNPADSTTTISILGHATGGNAVFKGKGVELHARDLNISRPDNKFWAPGPGRLIANTAQINTPGTPSTSTNNQLIVTWNKEMVCDGLVLQFIGQADKDGNRVQVVHQTQTLWCTVMELWLNRRVMFFDDQSTVEPKAVEIKCSGDVTVRNRQLDAQGKQKSVDFAQFAHLHYDVEKNYFVAAGPGELHSVLLGSGHGFDQAAQPVRAGNNEHLNFLGVWFMNDMRGTLLGNNKKVDIKGRVEAVYTPAANWNDTISRENIAAARRTGYLLECEQLLIVEVPDPLNVSQSSMELTASTNARIDGRGGMSARARKIMYNQAKSTVQLDGNVHLQTMVQGQRVTHPAGESIRYNVETGAVEMIQVQGIGVGQ